MQPTGVARVPQPKRRRSVIESFGGPKVAPFLFIAPAVFFFLTVTIVPTILGVPLSAMRWNLLGAKVFIGLDNFREILTDKLFWQTMKNTGIYTLIGVPVEILLALGVALLLNRDDLPLKNLFRTFYFLPVITSTVAAVFIWEWLYHPNFGLFNYMFGKIGLGPFPWLAHPKTAMMSMIIYTVWKGMGYRTVIFLAGLQGIPKETMEAAEIDGATAIQRFWNVTMPLLRATTFLNVLTATIGSLMDFSVSYLMVGPLDSTTLAVKYIYETAFKSLRMGYAAAMAMVLFMIVMVITWIQWKTRREMTYD